MAIDPHTSPPPPNGPGYETRDANPSSLVKFGIGMAVTLIVTAMIAPVTQIRTLVRRWTTRHLPAVIHANPSRSSSAFSPSTFLSRSSAFRFESSTLSSIDLPAS